MDLIIPGPVLVYLSPLVSLEFLRPFFIRHYPVSRFEIVLSFAHVRIANILQQVIAAAAKPRKRKAMEVVPGTPTETFLMR
ncbi:hypothetical protein [Kiloniella laminariae]|uniref:hypothetical protein n=1 Tax=Kiloniella laminariae TaxID=454162 RepID=UPI00036065F6|nr:hypothetical protein [Kiloniella laminariae]